MHPCSFRPRSHSLTLPLRLVLLQHVAIALVLVCCEAGGALAFLPAAVSGRESAGACSAAAMSAASGRLQGRKVLVTGGGRGIGRAIALACAEEGARVAILARTRDELDAVAAEALGRLKAQIAVVVADVTEEEQVAEAVAEASRAMGGIDILVNNAGGAGAKAPFHQQEVAAFRKLLDLNVVSVVIVSSAVLNQCMLPAKCGAIINVSSRAGKTGIPAMSTYCASKCVKLNTFFCRARARTHTHTHTRHTHTFSLGADRCKSEGALSLYAHSVPFMLDTAGLVARGCPDPHPSTLNPQPSTLHPMVARGCPNS